MKRRVLKTLILLALTALAACNQPGRHYTPVVLNLPHHHIHPTDTAGTIIFTKLTNTSNHSITLHPLLTPLHATDSASLISALLAQLTPTQNADSLRLQLVQIVGHYLKSPYKISFLPNVKDGNNHLLIRRTYSFIGSSFSLPGWHCDNFCKEAIYLLQATGYFADSDFIMQNCRIHTAMQIKLPCGDTVFADMAVGTPVFMVPCRAKKCGWASLNDIINNTALVDQQCRYYYKAGHAAPIDLAPDRSINNYKLIFNLPWKTHRYGASNHRLFNFNGDFILAPGQSIEYKDTLGFIIDTTINNNGGLINSAMQKVAAFAVNGKINDRPQLLDSALYYLYKPYARILNISVMQAASLFNAGKIMLYNGSSNFTPSYMPQQAVLYNTIPANNDTLYYGVQTSFPFLITHSTSKTNGAITSTFDINFYSSALFCPVPEIADTQFNYANGVGTFAHIPPHTTVKQTLLYNYNIFDFYTGGAMFLASDTGIIIQSSNDVAGK